MPFQRIEVSLVAENGAAVPRYATVGAAGVDLCAAEETELGPMERKLVRTGLRVAIPEGYEGQVRPRSGLALRSGIGMVNAPGTIDSDYRGEIGVILVNFGTTPFFIRRGDRIAQLVFCPVVHADFVVTDQLEDTQRGGGGFGSTGTR